MTTSPLPVVRVGNLDGVVIESAEPSCFCFVPLASLKASTDGQWAVDEAAYVRSSWHKRNCAFNTQAGGAALFPRSDGLIADRSVSAAQNYLELLQRSYAQPRALAWQRAT